MKINPIPIRLLISLSLGLIMPAVSATEVSAKVIAFSCYGCHDSDGTSKKPGLPKLKAKPANELGKKLLDFKYDRTSSTIMGRITKGYTDTELKAVAQYLSQLK
jgi:sulfide dehydrogenase cytochrome subunit